MNEKILSHGSPNFAQKVIYAETMTIDSANILTVGTKKPLTGGEIMATASAETRVQKVVRYVPWTLATALAGDNNDIVFTAKYPYTNIKIEYIDPSANSAVLSLGFGKINTITVNLATSGAGAITTTANDIIALINGNALAKNMVSAALKGTDTGATAVTALTATALAGGNHPIGYLFYSTDVIDGDETCSIIKSGVLLNTVTNIGLPGFTFIPQS